MIYAQITNGVVLNTISLDDPGLIPVFKEGYDYILPIGALIPQPEISWTYDSGSGIFSAPVVALDQLKEERYSQVDQRTGELITQGFPFAGHTFSMSINAQINWSNFPNIPDALFPLNIMDVNESVFVCSLANKMNFYFTALNWKNQALQSGSILKGQIKACADDACVNAIVDNR